MVRARGLYSPYLSPPHTPSEEEKRKWRAHPSVKKELQKKRETMSDVLLDQSFLDSIAHEVRPVSPVSFSGDRSSCSYHRKIQRDYSRISPRKRSAAKAAAGAPQHRDTFEKPLFFAWEGTERDDEGWKIAEEKYLKHKRGGKSFNQERNGPTSPKDRVPKQSPSFSSKGTPHTPPFSSTLSPILSTIATQATQEGDKHSITDPPTFSLGKSTDETTIVHNVKGDNDSNSTTVSSSTVDDSLLDTSSTTTSGIYPATASSTSPPSTFRHHGSLAQQSNFRTSTGSRPIGSGTVDHDTSHWRTESIRPEQQEASPLAPSKKAELSASQAFSWPDRAGVSSSSRPAAHFPQEPLGADPHALWLWHQWQFWWQQYYAAWEKYTHSSDVGDPQTLHASLGLSAEAVPIPRPPSLPGVSDTRDDSTDTAFESRSTLNPDADNHHILVLGTDMSGGGHNESISERSKFKSEQDKSASEKYHGHSGEQSGEGIGEGDLCDKDRTGRFEGDSSETYNQGVRGAWSRADTIQSKPSPVDSRNTISTHKESTLSCTSNSRRLSRGRKGEPLCDTAEPGSRSRLKIDREVVNKPMKADSEEGNYTKNHQVKDELGSKKHKGQRSRKTRKGGQKSAAASELETKETNASTDCVSTLSRPEGADTRRSSVGMSGICDRGSTNERRESRRNFNSNLRVEIRPPWQSNAESTISCPSSPFSLPSPVTDSLSRYSTHTTAPLTSFSKVGSETEELEFSLLTNTKFEPDLDYESRRERAWSEPRFSYFSPATSPSEQSFSHLALEEDRTSPRIRSSSERLSTFECLSREGQPPQDSYLTRKNIGGSSTIFSNLIREKERRRMSLLKIKSEMRGSVRSEGKPVYSSEESPSHISTSPEVSGVLQPSSNTHEAPISLSRAKL